MAGQEIGKIMCLRNLLCLLICLGVFTPNPAACLETGEVVIVTSEKMINLNVRKMITPEEWEKGLKGEKGLEDNEGMQFVFPREGVYTFTTKGVSFPIDIIMVNKTGRIVVIFENAKGDRNYATPLPILSAIEVKGGFCEKMGIKRGHGVYTKGAPLFPKDEARTKEEDRARVEKKLLENLKKYPKDTQVHEDLAYFYTISGMHKKAEKYFRELINIEPTAQRLNGLGVTLGNTGRIEEAEKYFMKTIEKDPLFFSSYRNLVRSYHRRGESDKALTLLHETLEKYPDFVQVRLSLARTYLANGELKAAEDLFGSLDNTEDPMMIRTIGDIHVRSGRLSQAAEAYKKYLAKRPYDPHASDLRAFTVVHLAKKEQTQ